MDALPPPIALRPRAWYSAEIDRFVVTSSTEVVGALSQRSEGDIARDQVSAWAREVGILQRELAGLAGVIFLEFVVPRVRTRPDAVLIIGPAVFVLEFKSKDSDERQGLRQAWDYCLELKDFHLGSRGVNLLPIFVCPLEGLGALPLPREGQDRVYDPIPVPQNLLGLSLRSWSGAISAPMVDPKAWADAAYRPTPSVIEAARALFASHTVAEIAQSEAGADELNRTSIQISRLASDTMRRGAKGICFVTGVPGAGKTLIGLGLATQAMPGGVHATYLSGNGPLVKVLSAALARDARKRDRGRRGGRAEQEVRQFILNVHKFRDEGLASAAPPSEHLVVFDEAQRAWDRERTIEFMAKRDHPNFGRSEAEFLLEYMDRRDDWVFVVCLVGNGQEIHRGEAGIGAWFQALGNRFRHFEVHVSPRVLSTEFVSGADLQVVNSLSNLRQDEALDLAVSVRSYRSGNVSQFVNAFIRIDPDQARQQFNAIANFPIRITRSIEAAKVWLRKQTRGNQRSGIVASSRGGRLRPYGIDLRIEFEPEAWFLNGVDDVRSSNSFEMVATEFDVQGLELDWVCVAWDADLRIENGQWQHFHFSGTKWSVEHKPANQAYLENAYRVLLTRARQGMVIFLPSGEPNDRTRDPRFYDQTFEYLRSIGIPELISPRPGGCG